ncbi:hypothetical protein V8F06_003417 [Rhypophila decipiens]
MPHRELWQELFPLFPVAPLILCTFLTRPPYNHTTSCRGSSVSLIQDIPDRNHFSRISYPNETAEQFGGSVEAPSKLGQVFPKTQPVHVAGIIPASYSQKCGSDTRPPHLIAPARSTLGKGANPRPLNRLGRLQNSTRCTGISSP